jgi:hypothetical protein
MWRAPYIHLDRTADLPHYHRLPVVAQEILTLHLGVHLHGRMGTGHREEEAIVAAMVAVAEVFHR